MLKRRLIFAAAAFAAGAIFTRPGMAQGKKGGRSDDKPAPLIGIDGRYASWGRNVDGSSYKGEVTVVQQGEAVEFTWVVGKETLHGAGIIEGRVVTVDWGDDTPVIYVVMSDGTLHGTWADGTALEKMTPR